MTWIENNQKYALLALNIDTFDNPASFSARSGIFLKQNLDFSIPNIWRDWIGSIRCREIEEANLYIYKCLSSENVNTLDQETYLLENAVTLFHYSLLLSGYTSIHRAPVIVSGYFEDDRLEVRRTSRPIWPVVLGYARIANQSLVSYSVADSIFEVLDNSSQIQNYRLNQVVNTYLLARTQTILLDRIHQYVRCIEALIVPDIASTKRQFKSRSELFVGPRYHSLFDDIYDIRSFNEHMRDIEFPVTREIRLHHAKIDIIMENLARHCIQRVLLDSRLREVFSIIAV